MTNNELKASGPPSVHVQERRGSCGCTGESSPVLLLVFDQISVT